MPGRRAPSAAASSPRRSARLGAPLLAALLLTSILPAVPFAPPARADPAPLATVTSERVAGTDRYGTAVAISQRLYPDGNVPAGGVPIVYLASGQTYADAVAAGPLAARARGVILLTPGANLPAAVSTELARLRPQRLIVLGGASVVSDAVLGAAGTAAGVTPERMAGTDRYATAVAAVQDAFSSGLSGTDTVFLATGANFPDALSVGA
ncbi:MAG TPA: cell wall-binding repeat-containing protein, partial [Candidatus Dormibacteraeota bacterium]|nr:cell wall-binding repeat-containing protein [Candidatus Dormibacteraeota bacterium]